MRVPPTLACVAVVVLGSAVIVAAEPLLVNADFSAFGETGQAEGWAGNWRPHWATVADDEGHSGKHCVRLQLHGPEKAAIGITQHASCQPNTEYVLTAWLKSARLSPAVGIRTPGRDGRFLVHWQTLTDHERWQRHTVRFNSGDATELVVILITHAGDDEYPAGEAWADDVQIWPAAEYRAEEGAEEAQRPANVALGRPYTLSPGPNYGYCTDDGDNTQLTDGEYVEGYFWVQQGTVGWSGAPYADISIDLGEVSPIAGCTFSTAAGVAGVAWPALIQLLVSDDGETWYAGGDLIACAARDGLPSAEEYSTHRYVCDDLRLHGRYFRLLVGGAGAYTFCDEIEVYQGPEELLAADLGKPIEGDPREALVSARVAAAVRQRLLKDIAALAEAAEAEGVSDETRAWAVGEVERLTAAAMAEPGDFDAKWRAIHPLTPIHAEIHKARARVKRELGAPTFVAWRNWRWDMLDPMELPPEAGPDRRIAVHTMRGEFRSEAVNASNMSDEDIVVDVWAEGLPGGARPEYLTVHQVEWIETQAGIPVADALPVAEETDRGWRVSVPAGMTRQIWLTFHTVGVEPGTYDGNLIVAPDLGGAKSTAFPLHLRVYPVELPEKLSCSLGMWDYTCGHAYDLTAENVGAAIANMQAHFYDTPWASSGCAPWPAAFDAEGNIVGELDFDRFDGWIADWADATNYAVFLAVGSAICNVPMADPRFPTAVGRWMDAWVAHLRGLEIEPKRLMLLLVDEPHASEQDEVIVAWAKAIEATQPEVVIWEDPVYREPETVENTEMFEVSDLLCPNLGIFGGGTDAHREFYQKLRQQGKTLWFYQCSGPAKTFDPYYYHRLQHWYAFKYGATGSGFWAYADAARTGNSWNELRAGRASYTPVYIDEDSVTDGKHFEAVREGLEDYEVLRMVRDRAEELEADGKRARAETLRQLVQTAIDAVCGAGYDPGQIPWIIDKDRTVADEMRVKLLEALTEE